MLLVVSFFLFMLVVCFVDQLYHVCLLWASLPELNNDRLAVTRPASVSLASSSSIKAVLGMQVRTVRPNTAADFRAPPFFGGGEEFTRG